MGETNTKGKHLWISAGCFARVNSQNDNSRLHSRLTQAYRPRLSARLTPKYDLQAYSAKLRGPENTNRQAKIARAWCTFHCQRYGRSVLDVRKLAQAYCSLASRGTSALSLSPHVRVHFDALNANTCVRKGRYLVTKTLARV